MPTLLLTFAAGAIVAPGLFLAVGFLIAKRKISAARLQEKRTADLHLATIEALARAIDTKDQTAAHHVKRVQAYAAGLAKAIGLPEEDIEGIRTAALLHDVGREDVAEPWQAGADILATVPFRYPVAHLLRSHHERWDGSGYPAGLKGEQIPVGARILHIVDHFDTVTTDRPHQKALSLETAIAMLRLEAGRGLDPRLVHTFIDLLPWFTAQFSESPAQTSETGGAIFKDIALAHGEIYALYDIAQSMGTSLSVTDTMALISSKIASVVPWSTCSLFLYNAPDDTVTCRYAAGADAARLENRTLKAGMGLWGWISRQRQTLVRNTRLDVDDQALPGATFQSALVCPLIVRDRFIGTLGLYHADRDRYTDDHRRLLEQIAEQAAAVIQNSLVFEQTQADSLTDPLTGLPNRRSMAAHLTRELARAERMNGEVALIVMDIDGFKAINDGYGHHVGDRALRDVAATLLRSLRRYDLIARYGGDEFIVVLSDCSRESADAKCRELQQLVSAVHVEVAPGHTQRIAASAGVSVYPHDGRTQETLLADSDRRMYLDKARRAGAPAAHVASDLAELLGTEPTPLRLASSRSFPRTRMARVR